jgi:hypothetical protein
MKLYLAILTFTLALFIQTAPVWAQGDEIALNPAQAKITTVAAMRARKAPQTTAEEIMRLKLGTVVSATNRSGNQDTIAGKTDYWYFVALPNGEKGWLFGGLLMDYDARRRTQLLREIIEARLKAEKTEFADRQETYNLANSSIAEAKDMNTRAEFELLKLLALANWAETFPQAQEKSPFRDVVKAHAAEIVADEFAGGYSVRTELFWNLETKYHALPVGERIAWAAAQNRLPSDCEGDEVCSFFVIDGEIKYLSLHPNGAHAGEALKDLSEALTDAVIEMANGKGGDKYAVQQRVDLKKDLAALRLAVGKTSAPEKAEVLGKLGRVK